MYKKSYKEAMVPIFGKNKTIRANVIPFPDATMGDYGSDNFCQAMFPKLIEENPENVYEIMVHPKERAEEIEKRLFFKIELVVEMKLGLLSF